MSSFDYDKIMFGSKGEDINFFYDDKHENKIDIVKTSLCVTNSDGDNIASVKNGMCRILDFWITSETIELEDPWHDFNFFFINTWDNFYGAITCYAWDHEDEDDDNSQIYRAIEPYIEWLENLEYISPIGYWKMKHNDGVWLQKVKERIGSYNFKYVSGHKRWS